MQDKEVGMPISRPSQRTESGPLVERLANDCSCACFKLGVLKHFSVKRQRVVVLGFRQPLSHYSELPF